MQLDDAVKALREAEAAVPAAREAVKAAIERREARRGELHAAIVTAYRRGMGVMELARATGYEREQIRRILRRAGE